MSVLADQRARRLFLPDSGVLIFFLYLVNPELSLIAEKRVFSHLGKVSHLS